MTKQVFNETKEMLTVLSAKLAASEGVQMSLKEKQIYDSEKKYYLRLEEEFKRFKLNMVAPLKILEAENFDEYDNRIGAYSQQCAEEILPESEAHLEEIQQLRHILETSFLDPEDVELIDDLHTEFIVKTKRFNEHKRCFAISEFENSIFKCRKMTLAKVENKMRAENSIAQHLKLAAEWDMPM